MSVWQRLHFCEQPVWGFISRNLLLLCLKQHLFQNKFLFTSVLWSYRSLC